MPSSFQSSDCLADRLGYRRVREEDLDALVYVDGGTIMGYYLRHAPADRDHLFRWPSPEPFQEGR